MELYYKKQQQQQQQKKKHNTKYGFSWTEAKRDQRNFQDEISKNFLDHETQKQVLF